MYYCSCREVAGMTRHENYMSSHTCAKTTLYYLLCSPLDGLPPVASPSYGGNTAKPSCLHFMFTVS